MNGVPDLALIFLALFALIIGAVLTAGETALTRVTRAHAAELASEGKPRAAAVQRLIDERHSAILGTGFVRVMAEMTAAVAITLVLATTVTTWWLAFGAAVGISALLLLVITGASPRRLGRRHPADTTHALAPILLALATLGRPIWALSSRFAPGRTTREQTADTAEEMRDMVDLVSESEHLEDDEREMLHSVFELGRTITREVMVPRTEMVTIDADATLESAMRLFVRSGYSRIPVIGDDIEDIRGILYLKDALRRRENPRTDESQGAIPVEHIARNAEFVPETLLVDELLEQMQTRSFHMAIVIDEYGLIAGLVTLEDLLEELVGDMTDEHDHAEPEVEELADGTWRVPARLPVDELGEIFDLPVDDDDVDTVGGLLTKALGRVPIEGAIARVQGLELVAERAGGRRRQIETVLARRMSEDEEKDE